MWSYSERNVSYWIFKQVAHVENALYITFGVQNIFTLTVEDSTDHYNFQTWEKLYGYKN